VNIFLKLLLREAFFGSKCTKYRLAARFSPNALGELTALRPHSWIRGSLLLRKGYGKVVDGRGGEGGGGKGEGPSF